MSEGARRAVAGAAFGLAAPLAYVAARAYEALRGVPTDPTLLIAEAHTAFYWRCGAATWWGVVAAVAAYAFADRARRPLLLAVVPAALLIGLVAFLIP